jgi:hypothetical protein
MGYLSTMAMIESGADRPILPTGQHGLDTLL